MTECGLHLPNHVLLVSGTVNIINLELKELLLFEGVSHLYLLGEIGVEVVVDQFCLPEEQPLRVLPTLSLVDLYLGI